MSISTTSPASSSKPLPSPTRPNHARGLSRSTMERFTFTLGKLDAGMAILLGPNAHLLEFPSLLLPTPAPGQPPLGPGSILTITVSRDLSAEQKAQEEFTNLQSQILDSFSTTPSAPVLRLRNVTQTSVCVEWEGLQLGSAGFRGLEMMKNGQRWGRVGGGGGFGEKGKKEKEKEKREWKTGGLQSGEEYTFQLVLKTTAGTHTSNVIRVRTHTMDNLTGLYIHFGPVQPPALLDKLRGCLEDIGARESAALELDTTHFVCTTPIVGGDDMGRGGTIDPAYQEAIKANLPVVGPDWLFAIARDRKLVPISNYLLPAPPPNMTPSSAPAPFKRPEPLKRASLPFTSSAPSSPIYERPEEIRRSPSPETIARMSMTGSGSSTGPSRDDSIDRRRSREGSLPVGGLERRRSREASVPIEVEVPRPRSPKPEADGKLDRGFKFPLKTDSAASSPTTAKSITSAPVSASTNGPSGSVHQPQEEIPLESDTTRTKAESTVDAIVAGPVSAEPVTMETPTTPTVMVTPPVESTETLPIQDVPADHDEHRASTIDEAIAEFNTAVGKKSEDESDSVKPVTDGTSEIIEPALTPVEEIMKDDEEVRTSIAEAETVKEEADTKIEQEATEDVDGEIASESIEQEKTEMNTVKDHDEVEREDEEGDKTMDEIDLT